MSTNKEFTLAEIQEIETEIVKEVAAICKRKGIDYFLHCGSALGAIRHNGPIPWDSDVDIIVPFNQFENFCAAMRSELPGKFYLDYYENNRIYTALFPRIGLKGYSTVSLHVDVFKLVGISFEKNEQVKFTKKANLLSNIFFLKSATEKYRGKLSLSNLIYIYALKFILLPFCRSWVIRSFENHCRKYPYDKAVYVTNPGGNYGLKNVMEKKVYGNGTFVKYSGIDVKIPEQYDYYLKHYYGDYMQFPPEEARKKKQIYYITKYD